MMNSLPLPPACTPGAGRPRTRLDSFRDAARGLVWMFATQPNARVHLVALIAAVGVSAWLRISAAEWGAVLLCSGFMFAAEAFNSALEVLADEVSTEHRPRIGRAKDAAAGAVLAAALTAIAVGVCVFGPRLWERFVT